MITVDTILSDFHDLSKLEDLCRLCGKLQQTNVPIFDETHRYNYFKLINIHFKDELQVSKTDILPLKLCAKCLKAVMTWHEFYHDCLKVEKKFKKLVDKFSLNQDSEKRSSALVNDVEVIEVSVDGDNYDFFNESANDFDISNVNIKESTTFANANNFSHFDSLVNANDSVSSAENKTSDKPSDHSEPAISGDKNTSLPLQQKTKKKKSTVCRICGKLYTNRSTYLSHLQKAHSSHHTAKAAKKSSTQPQSQQQSKQAESQPSQPAQQKTSANAVPDICYKCGNMFKHPSSLRNHLKYIHGAADPETAKLPPRPPKMCDLCGKLCKGNYFKSHMLKHSNPDSVTCKDCGKVFAYASTLRSHIRVCHTDVRPFQCTVCAMGFKRADYLRAHFRAKHRDAKMENTYKCDHCGLSYKTKKNYLIHLKAHEDGYVKTVKRRPRAREEIDPDGTVKYWCTKCDLPFKKKNYLLLHDRYVHVKGKPYSISENAEGQFKCDQCDRRFSSVSGRNYHCKITHGKKFDMNFNAQCDHCGLRFTNRVFYAKHRARLNGTPTCYLCSQQFNTDEELTKHVDIDHFTDLPFVCEICKKRFVALKNLDHHIRTRHYNDKPYKCDICDHRTTRKDSLEIHIRGLHLGEKPYECEFCGKKFSQKNDCRKHKVKHDSSWQK